MRIVVPGLGGAIGYLGLFLPSFLSISIHKYPPGGGGVAVIKNHKIRKMLFQNIQKQRLFEI